MYTLFSLLSSLLVDTTFSWIRMFIALGISIPLSLAVGITAARSATAEKLILPIVDVLQTLPILAFFPIAVYLIVGFLPGYIGINYAVIFLIVISMVWNIIFGVYESVKLIPENYIQMAKVYGIGRLSRIKNIYIPASMGKVANQSILSWSIGLFYLVTSEIFSTGSSVYAVKYGIGVELLKLGLSGHILDYLIGISVFLLFVIGTRFLFFMPFEKAFNLNLKDKKTRKFPNMNIFGNTTIKTIRGRIPKISTTINIKARKKKTRAMIPPKMKLLLLKYVPYASVSILALASILILLTNPILLIYEYKALTSLAFSFVRIWFVFALIFVVSVIISIHIKFRSKNGSKYILIMQILASLPATILLPIIVKYMVNFPYHAEIVAFIIFFLSGIWYSIFSTISTGNSVPNYIFDIVKVFHVKGKEATRKIYMKALMPGIITGGITAVAAEWNASIVAERFTTTAIGSGKVITSVGTGVGKLLDISLEQGNIVLMIIVLINMTIIIIIINKLVWHKLYNRTTTLQK